MCFLGGHKANFAVHLFEGLIASAVRQLKCVPNGLLLPLLFCLPIERLARKVSFILSLFHSFRPGIL